MDEDETKKLVRKVRDLESDLEKVRRDVDSLKRTVRQLEADVHRLQSARR